MTDEERKEYSREYSRKYYRKNKERWGEYRQDAKQRKKKKDWEQGGSGRYSVPRQMSSHGYYSQESIRAAYEQRREQQRIKNARRNSARYSSTVSA